MDTHARTPYQTDVSDDEWAFVAPYLVLMDEAAPQRKYPLRELFNGLRFIARTGLQWRLMPHDLPPWTAVYQQTRRWMKAGVFETIVHDLRVIVRQAQGRAAEPTAMIIDSRTLRSTPESGARAGWDGHKRTQGSKVHAAVDTLGQLLALHVTPANVPDLREVGAVAEAVQAATGEHVELAYVDQGYAGPTAATAAAAHGIRLDVVRAPAAKRGFVLLPRRWVVERSFAWTARFRRLTRDYERLQTTLEGCHSVAFTILAVHAALPLLADHIQSA